MLIYFWVQGQQVLPEVGFTSLQMARTHCFMTSICAKRHTASRGYPAKRALSAMRKYGGQGPFGRIPSITGDIVYCHWFHHENNRCVLSLTKDITKFRPPNHKTWKTFSLDISRTRLNIWWQLTNTSTLMIVCNISVCRRWSFLTRI